jgi:hypothetical protein
VRLSIRVLVIGKAEIEIVKVAKKLLIEIK